MLAHGMRDRRLLAKACVFECAKKNVRLHWFVVRLNANDGRTFCAPRRFIRNPSVWSSEISKNLKRDRLSPTLILNRGTLIALREFVLAQRVPLIHELYRTMLLYRTSAECQLGQPQINLIEFQSTLNDIVTVAISIKH